MRPKYQALLNIPDVRRWYQNNARSSIVTAEERLRRLGRVCVELGSAPMSLLEVKREDGETFDRQLMDYVDDRLRDGMHPAQVRNNLLVLKSWLGFNGLSFDRKIRLPPIDYGLERIPTKPELASILRHCDPRTRVMAALVAFSGLRLESIGSYTGSDGLRLGDLPELSIKEEAVVIGKVPMMVVVRPSLSKARHQYVTFLTEEGCRYLKELLDSRLRAAEKFSPDSPVVAPIKARKHEFLRTMKASYNIKRAILEAGFGFRPYALRSYFGTALDICESRGLVSHSWRQFWMGHSGDIEATYSVKKRLSPEILEEMRAAFARCEPVLSPSTEEVNGTFIIKEAKLEVLRSVAKALGIEPSYVKTQREKVVGRQLSSEEEIELLESEVKRLRKPAPDPQMIVEELELPDYLKGGWQFVAVLPNGKMVVRK